MAAALGTTFLANTYQTANTTPNLVFELVAAGVLTSVFVPTFVEYLVRREHARGMEGRQRADVGRPPRAHRALDSRCSGRASDHERADDRSRGPAVASNEIELGSTFLRLFAPQVIFYGVGMIMTGALHAYRKFAMPAIAPIFNNAIVIGAYLAYMIMRSDASADRRGDQHRRDPRAGARNHSGSRGDDRLSYPAGARSLGVALAVAPQFSHPAVKKAAHVGAWALGYAGGYQAGLIVVLILANRIVGGVAAYQWAYVFFFVPHALFAAPIFHVLFPAMSEDAARGETGSLEGRLRDAMKMLFFILAPIAAGMFVAGEQIARVTLQYGIMSASDAASRGPRDRRVRNRPAHLLGLPCSDPRLLRSERSEDAGSRERGRGCRIECGGSPSLLCAGLDAWSVPGLAFGHSIGFLAGTALLVWLLLRRKIAIVVKDVYVSVGISVGGAVLARRPDGDSACPSARRVEGRRAHRADRHDRRGGRGLHRNDDLHALGRTPASACSEKQEGRMSEGKRRVLQVLGQSAGGIARHVALVTEGLDGRDGLTVDIAAPENLPVSLPKDVHALVHSQWGGRRSPGRARTPARTSSSRGRTTSYTRTGCEPGSTRDSL